MINEDKKMANGTIEPTEPSPNISPDRNPNPFSEPYSAPAKPPYYGEMPKPKNKTIIIILGVIVGILLVVTVGTSIVLYTRAWDPLWNPFRPEPDKVIQEMTQRMKEVKTIHSETKINTEIKNEGEFANILMIFNSDTDTSDSKNQKSAGDFNLAFSKKSASSYGPNEIKFSLGGEARSIGQISYFKINTIPSMIADSLRNEIGIDLNELFTNKWAKIDSKSMENLLKDLQQTTGTMRAIDIYKESNKKELQDKIKNIITGKQFFLVKKELPDSVVNGVNSYHYILTLDKKELKSIIPEFVIIYIDMAIEMMPSDYPLTEEDIYEAKKQITQELNKAFDEIFLRVGDIDGEVWIGKKDYLLYGVKINKLIDLSKIDKYSTGAITFQVDMNFSNFDKPVVIEAPKESTDILEILMPIIETSLEQARKRAKDAEIMADMSFIRSLAEFIYDDNYSYETLCTELPTKKLDTSVPSYGSQLGEIEYSIKTVQGGVLDLICLDSKNSYCIVAGLPSGGRYCVDSSGMAGEIPEHTCLGTGTSANPYKCPTHVYQ